MKKIIALALFIFLSATGISFAQDNTTVKRTPEEEKELFGYCDKPEMIRTLKLSPEQVDKVAEVDLWAKKEQLTIDANTNERFATAGELKQEVLKKYKAFLSADQAKAVLDYKRSASCPITELNVNHAYDTLVPARALQLFKTPWRKLLIEKLGPVGNGRMADMLFEAEVWKQKESLTIDKIPVSDFNRIRKTVALYQERDRRFLATGIGADQLAQMIQFFEEHQLYKK